MNNNMNKSESQSQKSAIKQALLNGEKLTNIDLFYRYGAYRGQARINDLRNEGLVIDTRMVKVGRYWVAEYSLGKENVSKINLKRNGGENEE